MQIEECFTNQAIMGQKGHEYRVFAVNKACQPRHILAVAANPDEIDGAMTALLTFDEKALRSMDPVPPKEE